MPGVSMRLIFCLFHSANARLADKRVLAGDLFFVEVGDGRAVVDFAEAIDHAGVGEDGGGELCLSRTGVSDERDIPDAGGVVDLHTMVPPLGRR